MKRTKKETRERFSRWIISSENKDGECKGYCPVHEDPEISRTPSASFNFSKGTFMCFSRCGGMSLSTLYEAMVEEGELSPAPPRSKPAERKASPNGRVNGSKNGKVTKLPSNRDVRGWTERLLGLRSALKPLKVQRGLTSRTVEKYELGWDGERYTIPVRDETGEIVNVRRYKMNASRDKVLNWPNWGRGGQLYLVDSLDRDDIVLCEGEMDALIGRQYKLNTLTFTTGANSWRDYWSEKFKDKIVYICFDADDTGRQGAKKAASSISRYAKEVRIISLPLKQKGGDLTNYFVDQGFTSEDFRLLMKEAPLFERTSASKQKRRSSNPVKVGLEGSMNPAHTNRPIETTVTISGKVQPAHSLPRKISLDCEPGAWQATKCNNCPMSVYHGGHFMKEIAPDDALILRMIDRPEDQRRRDVLQSEEIPKTCPRIELNEEEYWSIEELIIVPSVDSYQEHVTSPISRKAYNVGAYKTPINTTVRMVGVNTTDPKGSRSILQAWECEQTQTSLDKFEMSEDLMEKLTRFNPEKGQTPLEKMAEISRDLEANVTHIYGRPELHIAYDLVWHSLMDFTFQNNRIGKGWLELLVVGDTRTGKSEMAGRLCDHYQAGVLRSCEGATLAGLVGGAQQVANTWAITWGTIPIQDRRLVVLDEISGLKDKNVIEQMSSVRSSGRAQVTKIVSQETSARTRLIWIGNPAEGLTLAQHPRGALDAIQQLIKNPEDIARFDLAISAASSDVSSSVINSMDPPKVRHRYTKELCSQLVLWAWSRGPNDVVWGKGSEQLIMERAEGMGARYIPEPPLVQVENIRVKLAKIAVAIAARLFSHRGDNAEKILVRKEHVLAAEEFLDRIYGMESFGYLEHSRKEIYRRRKADRSRRECKKYLRSHPDVLHSLVAVINDTAFRVRDLEEFGGLMKDEAQQAIMELLRMNMVSRRNRGYIRMQPELMAIVKSLDEEEES